MGHGFTTDGEVLNRQGGMLRSHGQYVMARADEFNREAALPPEVFSDLLADLHTGYVTAVAMVRSVMANVGSVFDATGEAMQNAAAAYVEQDERAVEELIRSGQLRPTI